MMEWLGWGALGAGLVLALRAVGDRLRQLASPAPPLVPPSDYAEASYVPLSDLYRYYGQIHGVDPSLLRAIAIVESGENPGAVNPADPSYGLCQVLCTADSETEHCRNALPEVPDFKQATPRKLLDPDFNLRIASQILSWNIRHWGGDVDRGIVAYNNWAAAVRGRNDQGLFYGDGNPEGYLARVRREWTRLGAGGAITI